MNAFIFVDIFKNEYKNIKFTSEDVLNVLFALSV